MVVSKGFSSQVEDVQGRTVKTVWSATSIKDLDGDVITDDAFKKTLDERYKSANLVYSLTDHKADFAHLLGKPKELYIENQKLIAITDIRKTLWGNDMIEYYKNGDVTQHSIGFLVPKGKQVQRDGYNEIQEVKLYEGSAVLFAANPNTPTIDVKSMTKEQAIEEHFNLFKSIEKSIKLMRSGNMTDERFELLEIQFEQQKSRQT
jgi:HK97 family phage prohead protease